MRVQHFQLGAEELKELHRRSAGAKRSRLVREDRQAVVCKHNGLGMAGSHLLVACPLGRAIRGGNGPRGPLPCT
eukprot:15470700-Alexandrium_andersonii.AAC.1